MEKKLRTRLLMVVMIYDRYLAISRWTPIFNTTWLLVFGYRVWILSITMKVCYEPCQSGCLHTKCCSRQIRNGVLLNRYRTTGGWSCGNNESSIKFNMRVYIKYVLNAVDMAPSVRLCTTKQKSCHRGSGEGSQGWRPRLVEHEFKNHGTTCKWRSDMEGLVNMHKNMQKEEENCYSHIW